MMRGLSASLLAACALAGRRVAADLYDPDYEYGYGLESGEYEDFSMEYDALAEDYNDFGYGANELDPYSYRDYDSGAGPMSYYDDEFDEYYDTYGAYGDEYGDDYGFEDSTRLPSDCTEDAKGKAKITGAVCDLKIAGMNASAKELPGGVDGTYKVTGCFNGRPKYVRAKSPEGEGRALWFSSTFNDWDISRGAEVNQTAILVYAGDGLEETRPNYISPNEWHIASEFSGANDGGVAGLYKNLNVTVKCTNNKELDGPTAEASTVYQPLLTSAEMEEKYRAVFTEYGKGQDRAGLNYPLLILVVVLGASAVMGVPWVLNRKVGDGTRTLGQVIRESQKNKIGHVN